MYQVLPINNPKGTLTISSHHPDDPPIVISLPSEVPLATEVKITTTTNSNNTNKTWYVVNNINGTGWQIEEDFLYNMKRTFECISEQFFEDLSYSTAKHVV